jgi:hypothetical protein
MNKPLLRGFAAAALSFALIGAACGGGGDDGKDDPTADPNASPALPTQAATRTSPTRPAATAVPATGNALVVANPKQQVQFVPTVEQFRAMPKTTIKGKEGVTLETLAAQAGITGPTLVTLDGVNPANNAFASTRYPFADVASNTIFVIDDTGHISMASDKLPDAELLVNVSSIVLE